MGARDAASPTDTWGHDYDDLLQFHDEGSDHNHHAPRDQHNHAFLQGQGLQAFFRVHTSKMSLVDRHSPGESQCGNGTDTSSTPACARVISSVYIFPNQSSNKFG